MMPATMIVLSIVNVHPASLAEMETDMLTFGIEEEFVFLDPDTLSPAHVAPAIQRELLAAGYKITEVQHEFFQSQIEFASPIFDSREVAVGSLSTFRTALLSVAAEHGVVVAGTGTPYQKSLAPIMTEDSRYEEIATVVAALSQEHEINGLHVHVGIPDQESGLRCLNSIRRWLPTLMAISANSPFWCGVDTGFASWRAIQSRRWTTAGCPPHFTDAQDYRNRVNALIGIGGTPDSGSIAWYARLSEHQPTLEIRVADAQLQPWSSILLALLCRGLVATCLDFAPCSQPEPTSEFMDAALWHGARYGMSGQLVHPLHQRLVPASEAIACLLETITPALAASEDLAAVSSLLLQLQVRGSGAQQQRAHYAIGGRDALALLFSSSAAPSIGFGEDDGYGNVANMPWPGSASSPVG
ncbi:MULTISPECIES: YbdK family carboxylate-amine ligase [Micrococcaceae]|uniref:carboxylate-amine ligase n=1 Tax=Micrococcaceae TaxID=1268 RepID=UPI001C4FB87C|nr:YbdK family carboxylate-amine ligase [Arthrobacter sp. BF1]